jgi:hypothetical protein
MFLLLFVLLIRMLSFDLFGSEDISLEGLQQELEECESDEVSYSLN